MLASSVVISSYQPETHTGLTFSPSLWLAHALRSIHLLSFAAASGSCTTWCTHTGFFPSLKFKMGQTGNFTIMRPQVCYLFPQTHGCVLSSQTLCLILEILTATVNSILQSALILSCLCLDWIQDCLYPWQQVSHFTCHWLTDKKRWTFIFSHESEALIVS